MRRTEQAGNLAQFGAGIIDGQGEAVEELAGAIRNRQRQLGLGIVLRLWLRGCPAVALLQRLPRARQRIALSVDQVLDLQGQLNVATAVKPLASAAFVGLELGKLRLPETQNIGLDAADAGHIPNLEVKAVGDRGLVEVALLR